MDLRVNTRDVGACFARRPRGACMRPREGDVANQWVDDLVRDREGSPPLLTSRNRVHRDGTQHPGRTR